MQGGSLVPGGALASEPAGRLLPDDVVVGPPPHPIAIQALATIANLHPVTLMLVLLYRGSFRGPMLACSIAPEVLRVLLVQFEHMIAYPRLE